MKKWKCSVCGYIHEGDEPPEKCPVCGADRSKFVELVEAEVVETAPQDIKTAQPKTPDTPKPRPDAQPAAAPAFDPIEEDTPEETPTRVQKYYAVATRLMVQHHAHPISVHIPNGVLPVAVLFLVLSLLFQATGLEAASFYNMVIVVLAMPIVLFSGYNDWKKRLGGNMTPVILTKMICGATVFGLGLFIVIWRWMNPLVALSPSSRVMYLFLHLVILGAAATAGFLGGKLIRFPGD